MRTIRHRLTTAKLAAIFALVLAAGGAAAWATTTGGKTIHACFKRHGGELRVAGRCKHGERPLSWNQIGPSGAIGARGATGKSGKAGPEGKQGPAGPAGPSDVYAGGTASVTLKSATAHESLASVSVPAGSYLIEAKAVLVTAKAEVTCALAPSTSFTTPWDAAAASDEVKVGNVVSLLTARTFTGTGTQAIELVCKGTPGAKVEDAHLAAIKTATLHGESPVGPLA